MNRPSVSLRRFTVLLLVTLLAAMVFSSSVFAASEKIEAESGDPRIVYEGTWQTSSLAGHSGGAVLFSNDGTPPVGKATLTFTGTGIDYVAAKWYNRGIAAVSLDGGPEEMVDLFYQPPGSPPYATSTVQFQQLVYSKRGLSPGSHTLTVRYTGDHNPLASNVSNYLITIDYFEVFDDPPPVVSTSASSTWSLALGVLFAGAFVAVLARRRAA
ncbi:MAG: hypothetical protein K0B85_09390 [Coriobacteriia bacterium]|nr:hypothetical protein [Coriobacteriia bacterium]